MRSTYLCRIPVYMLIRNHVLKKKNKKKSGSDVLQKKNTYGNLRM